MLNPEVIDLDGATLIERATRDCASLLGIHGDPELVRVYRWKDTTPQLEVGHLELMHHIETQLDAQRGLFITASGFRGTGIADCVADARRQAARAARFAATIAPQSLAS
jgi:oxygen-dependent protoporphyrinogen oxidase